MVSKVTLGWFHCENWKGRLGVCWIQVSITYIKICSCCTFGDNP